MPARHHQRDDADFVADLVDCHPNLEVAQAIRNLRSWIAADPSRQPSSNVAWGKRLASWLNGDEHRRSADRELQIAKRRRNRRREVAEPLVIKLQAALDDGWLAEARQVRERLATVVRHAWADLPPDEAAGRWDDHEAFWDVAFAEAEKAHPVESLTRDATRRLEPPPPRPLLEGHASSLQVPHARSGRTLALGEILQLLPERDP